MNNINFFIPKYHAALITMTGGGKTTLASKIFSNIPDRAIYVDYQDERILDVHPWITSTDKLGEAMRKVKKFVLRTNDVNEILAMVHYIFEQKREHPAFADQDVYLFFDEIQKYSQNQVIEDVFNMGRRWKIHGFAICRQIQEMKNLRIISEADEIIFLKLNDIGLSTLQNNYKIKIPPIVLDKINSGDRGEDGKLVSNYNSVLYDGFTWMLFDKNGDFIGEYNKNTKEEIENVDDNRSSDEKMSEPKGNENDTEGVPINDNK